MSKNYTYYLAELVRLDEDIIREVRAFLRMKRLPFSLVLIKQQKEDVKSSAKGSVIGVVNDYILDTYCFLKCRRSEEFSVVCEALSSVNRKMAHCVQLIKFNNKFCKLNEKEEKALLCIAKKHSDFIPFEEQKFKKHDMVQILKGKFHGYVGEVVTTKKVFKRRRIEAVRLSSNITVTTPRAFLRKA